MDQTFPQRGQGRFESGEPDLVSAAPLRVLVIHETDGRKYLEALVRLKKEGKVAALDFVGASVLRRLGHSLLRERKPLAVAFFQAWGNLRFRLTFWRIRDRVVILAVAPWDFRLFFYAGLRRRNRLIYHTSWPWWEGRRVPRPYGVLMQQMRRAWLATLADPRIDVVAVTRIAAEALIGVLPAKQPTVISHVASDAFLSVQARYDRPLRLLFVGELSEKKGLLPLWELMARLSGEGVGLEIVGDGALRAVAEDLAQKDHCRWHGHVRDRRRLAEIASGCQVFVSLAIRSSRWEELFGMAILEAMASGLPCLVTDHVGPRSIITDGVDGVLLPEGGTAAAEAWIRRLMDNRLLWEAMSAKARETARRYSVKATAKRWHNLLRCTSKNCPPVPNAR